MRFLRTPRYNTLLARGDMSYQGKLMLGTSPPRKENHLDVFNLGGEVNVNIFKVEDHLLAIGELPYGMEFDPITLASRPGKDGPHGGFFHFNDSLSELGVGCAHPIELPASAATGAGVSQAGDLISKTSTIPMAALGARTDYKIFRIPRGTSKREVLATFSRVEAAITYAHAFALPSPRYAVLPFWPLTIAKAAVLAGNNLHDGMRWKPEEGTKFTVMDLETGQATTFALNETVFGFHFANAFVRRIITPAAGAAGEAGAAGARGGGEQSSEGTEGDTAQLEIVADMITTSSAIFNSLMVDSFRNGSAIDHSELISES